MRYVDRVEQTTGRLRRTESQAQTRERLLDAAAAVFTRRGYDGASVDDIAEAAGFSKGAVYANFESKEALFLALFDRCLEDQDREVRAIMAREPDPLARLAAIGRWVPAFAGGLREWRLLETEFWVQAARLPALRRGLATRYQAQRGAIAVLLDEHYAALGAAPPLPTPRLAAAVVAMIGGLAMQQITDIAAIPPDLYASTLALLLRPSDGDGTVEQLITAPSPTPLRLETQLPS